MSKRIRLSEKERLQVARWYANTNSTVRKTAEHFNISKSNVHTILLETIDKKATTYPKLVEKIIKVRDKNIQERAMRGGSATKKMFEEKRKCK